MSLDRKVLRGQMDTVGQTSLEVLVDCDWVTPGRQESMFWQARATRLCKHHKREV